MLPARQKDSHLGIKDAAKLVDTAGQHVVHVDGRCSVMGQGVESSGTVRIVAGQALLLPKPGGQVPRQQGDDKIQDK